MKTETRTGLFIISKERAKEVIIKGKIVKSIDYQEKEYPPEQKEQASKYSRTENKAIYSLKTIREN